jgi:hypothetical protein
LTSIICIYSWNKSYNHEAVVMNLMVAFQLFVKEGHLTKK